MWPHKFTIFLLCSFDFIILLLFPILSSYISHAKAYVRTQSIHFLHLITLWSSNIDFCYMYRWDQRMKGKLLSTHVWNAFITFRTIDSDRLYIFVVVTLCNFLVLRKLNMDRLKSEWKMIYKSNCLQTGE